MKHFPIFMPYTVLGADAVPLFFQFFHAILQFFPVFLYYAVCNHIEPVRHQLFQGFITHNFKRGFIDAKDMRTIHRMPYYPAVNGSENLFQRFILFYNLLLICPLLRHINSHPNCTHYAAVQIIQRRLVSRQCPNPRSGLDNFLGYARLPLIHNLLFGLNAGRIVMLYIPDISMPSALHLLFCFIDCFTKTIIHFFMNAILVLIPDEIRNIVNRSFKIMAGLPIVLAHLTFLLPP